MTASRSDERPWRAAFMRRALSAIGLAAALSAAASPLAIRLAAQTAEQGQTGEPLQLVPQGNGDLNAQPAAGAGNSGTGQGSQSQGPSYQGATDAGPEKSGIEVLSLDQMDPDGLGLLDSESSGFGPAPWDGTSRATAIALLRQIPIDQESPTLLALGKRLLLAKAPPPSGKAPGNFLDLRLQQLFDWGLAAEVQKILVRLPQSRQSETTFRLSLQALLIEGQDRAACELVRREIVAYSSLDFWAKALIYCQIMDGEVEQAYLGLDLLRETGTADDPLFPVLAQRFAGADTAIKGNGQASVLNFAMLRSLDAPVPQGFAAKAPRALWPALATSDKLDPLERASLAEAAFRNGLIEAEALAAAYRALPFTAEERTAAVTSAPTVDGVLGRALLFQAAEAEKTVVTRVEVLKAMLERADSERSTDLVVPVAAPLMQDLRPRTDMAWFAETAVRSFLVMDDLERARAWLRLIERDAQTSEEAQAVLRRLWPLARLRGLQISLPDAGLAAWADGKVAGETADPASQQTALRQVYLLFAALRAAGLSDEASVTMLPDWADAEEPISVSYPLLLAMYDAGQNRRDGEGLLLSLAALGGQQWDQVSVTEAAEILNLLRDLGLNDAVERLAMEISLANGL